MIVRYVNHNGTEVNLNKEPYKMLVSDLLDYEWEVSTTSNRIVGFGYTVREKALNIDVHRSKSAGARENMNALTEIFETDILSGIPGRLYINDQYMTCYIKSSEKDNWGADQIIQCEYGIITDFPFWITETEFSFKISDITSTDNKRYPYKYPYRYANGMNNTYIINPHFTEANFKLRIYGPVVNPQVGIGGYPYLVNIMLEKGEYLEINSMKETVEKVAVNGERESVFHNRAKKKSIFKKVPPGKQEIVWPGTFYFDLLIYEERSEPKCQN